MFDYPNNLNKIFDKLKKNSIKPIIVGGYVRDSLMNIDSQQKNRSQRCCFSKDIDIELYGIESLDELESILNEFGDINSVGKSFGVCKLNFQNYEIDFTLPRSDNKISSGHKGFDIKVLPYSDYKDAAIRRDFTINSIGYDVIEKKILDPFNGQADLKNKILRAVNIDTFVEDPLRVFRAVQFSARFDFKLDNELFSLCKNMSDENLFKELAVERIFEEIKKLLLKSKKPSIGFRLLKDLNSLKYFPPLETLNYSSFDKINKILDNLVKYRTDSEYINTVLMLSALCYEFDNKQKSEFVLNLTNEKRILKDITALTKHRFKKSYTDPELFRLAVDVNIQHYLLLNRAVHREYDDSVFTIIEKRAKELNIFNQKAKPFLSGKDILKFGIEPSKRYSDILNKAYQQQMDLKIKNKQEAIKWLKKELLLS